MYKVIKVLEEVVLKKGWKRTIKGGFSLNINNLHIHLYFIATKYLWNNAHVEYIDSYTRSYSLVNIYRYR